MTRAIVDAELEVYVPSNSGSTPDHTIPNSDLRFVRINRRLQHSRDMGRIRVDNENGQYTDSLDIGDRVILRTQLEGEGSLSDTWTGLVKDLEFEVTGPSGNEVSLVCDDFVFGVLAIRFATYRFDDVQISGTSSSIVDKLVTENAPEIGTGQIGTVTETTDLILRRTNLLEALVDVADHVPVIFASDGEDLIFKERSEPDSQWTLQSTDRSAPWGSTVTDDGLANDVVVDGAHDTALDIEQTAADSFQTVTSTSRASQVVDVRKPDVAAIELDISPTGSGEAVIVRMQKNVSGSAVEEGSTSSDLARARLEASELIDGFNRFDFPQNDLGNYDPIFLVETDGSTGQDVAFDSGSGDLAYKVHYRFPVIASADDKDSIDDYRRHEGRYRRESLASLEEAKQVAPRIVAKRHEPGRTLRFPAESTRAHNLAPADVLTVDEPDVRAEGEFFVTDVDMEFRSGTRNRLSTNITLKDRTNL